MNEKLIEDFAEMMRLGHHRRTITNNLRLSQDQYLKMKAAYIAKGAAEIHLQTKTIPDDQEKLNNMWKRINTLIEMIGKEKNADTLAYLELAYEKEVYNYAQFDLYSHLKNKK